MRSALWIVPTNHRTRLVTELFPRCIFSFAN